MSEHREDRIRFGPERGGGPGGTTRMSNSVNAHIFAIGPIALPTRRRGARWPPFLLNVDFDSELFHFSSTVLAFVSLRFANGIWRQVTSPVPHWCCMQPRSCGKEWRETAADARESFFQRRRLLPWPLRSVFQDHFVTVQPSTFNDEDKHNTTADTTEL